MQKNLKTHSKTIFQTTLCLLLCLFWTQNLSAQTPKKTKPKPKITQPSNPQSGTRNPQPTKDTTDIIDIEWADEFIYEVIEGDTLQRLLGNVELSQDTVYMYADSARIRNSTNLTAIGNVILQQGDSVAVFADSVIYNSATKISDLYGEVILVNQGQKLFTDYLHYDMSTEVATYYSGATITDDSTTIQSEKGYFYMKTKEMLFKDSVVVVSPEFSLRSDTLKFNTDSKVATFLAPTLISQDSSKIYCEAGFYDTKNKSAEFRENPQYVDGEKIAIADTIRYDGNTKEVFLLGNARFEEGSRVATANRIRYNETTEVTLLEGNAVIVDDGQNIIADTIFYDKVNESYATRGRSHIVDGAQVLDANQVDYDQEKEMGIAVGDVIWRDTSQNITIVAEYADYKKENDYIKASGGRNGRPLFISDIGGDSLFMTADTLVSIKGDTLTGDTSRLMHAYFDVRIYKSDLQAVCDSLLYNTTDSLFWFYDNRPKETPIIWSDTTQFTADTIKLQLANNKINRILLRSNSFIINSPDERFFNQIKGKNSIAYFTKGELDYVHVKGSAESVYYPLDDGKAYIGANKTVCSEMKIYFGENTVTGIKFFSQPKATLSPMDKADHRALLMDGFRWENNRRPRSVDDLFEKRERKPVAVTLPVEKEEEGLKEGIENLKKEGKLEKEIEKVEGEVLDKKTFSKKKE
ncbi:MAG: lipopolysaccharide export system protein LptA [Paraglaciecola sp.]|jgi:lipopolysaccharide export system protein LptA